MAPPRISASPIPVLCMEWLLRQRRTDTIARAMIENNTRTVIFHSEGESAKSPNAAPRFST